MDETIYLGKGESWEAHQITEIACHPLAPKVDVCCFTIDNPPIYHKSNAVDVQESHLFPGEEVKFVGFPHGLSLTPLDPNDYRHGLVRTAFLSGVIDKNGAKTWIFDGFNNPGYSGGPIFKYLADQKTTWCGIVSGYLFEREDKGKLLKRVNDKVEEVENHFVRQNSGMIYAFGLAEIRHTGRMLKIPYKIEPESSESQ